DEAHAGIRHTRHRPACLAQDRTARSATAPADAARRLAGPCRARAVRPVVLGGIRCRRGTPVRDTGTGPRAFSAAEILCARPLRRPRKARCASGGGLTRRAADIWPAWAGVTA